MAFSINPITHVITIPQSDLTFVSGTLYTHDTEAFRLELKAWEATLVGMGHPKTNNHNTQVALAGTIYARGINILPPYSIEYENGFYSVVLQGSNNNIFDIQGGILVQNNVQVIPGNAAGLIIAETGTSGLTPSESTQLDRIDTNVTDNTSKLNSIEGNIATIETDIGTIQLDITGIQSDTAFMVAIESGEWHIVNNQMIFYNTSAVEIARFDLSGQSGQPAMVDVFRRVPV